MDERGYVQDRRSQEGHDPRLGFNVYPNELEDVVAACPGVLECCAIGVPDEKSGEVPKVFVVKKDPSLTEATVMEYCRKNLTGYKIPATSNSVPSCRRPTSARSCAARCATRS
jgi:long-chain acyl-CoA synthetase